MFCWNRYHIIIQLLCLTVTNDDRICGAFGVCLLPKLYVPPAKKRLSKQIRTFVSVSKFEFRQQWQNAISEIKVAPSTIRSSQCLKTPKVSRRGLHCRGWHHLNFWVNINQNWAYEKNWRKEGEIMNLFLNFYWMYL